VVCLKVSDFLALAVAVVLASVPSVAQAPDCTGISDVSDFNGPGGSDFVGQLTTVRVAAGLLRPLYVTSPPGDVDRLFILEQDGLIKILRDGVVLPTPFLDLSDVTLSPADDPPGHNEEGLLGMAFHPDYDVNGRLFVYHTNSTGTQQLIERYTVSGDPDVADPGSVELVIAVDHPTHGDQDGGMLAFGPLDGYLYIGTGDGGGDCDPPENAQSLDSNLGKLLRLNVDSLPASTAGNPFDGATAGNDEIWSFGLRNPWRFSFDRLDGKLLIGDVGESIWEEIDCQTPGSGGGENYGWNRYEGPQCPSPSPTCTNPGSCMIPGYDSPIRTYNHSTSGFSCSVVGGYVYRGCRMSDLHGTYFYADYCSNMINTFRVDGSCSPLAPVDHQRAADLAPGGGLFISQITSFGEDEQGELYVLDRAGEVFKILPTLGIMEVSGIDASLLSANADGDWIWEDLGKTSGHPISSYKVYRSESPAGTFSCVHQGSGNSWSGDGPMEPSAGEAFHYLVTAQNGTGEETRVGNRSDGTARDVDFFSACP
jgi:glucose/arabinose dehydrogenase